ncbi:MAG: hypothetical protein ACLPYY_18195 [Acidimicrobiales bacterium]
MVTFYYDPIIDEHLEVPAAVGGSIPTIYLAPQVPEEARKLWDIARAQIGMLEVNGPVPVIGPRFTALALLLARNWAVGDLADALQAACDEHYPPTWDRERGEMTWDLGLGEPYPRGQYNATMAAADAMTEGGWWRLGNVSSAQRFDEPTVRGVDFPTVALTRAEWDPATRQLHLALNPMNDAVVGQPTSMRVSGLDDPTTFRAGSPNGAPVEAAVEGPDLVLRTSVGNHSVLVGPD